MPKSQLDWLGVVSLWLGAAIMAVKAGNLPVIDGAPSWLAAQWWNYVPLVLLSTYFVIAIYRATKPQKETVAAYSSQEGGAPMPALKDDVKMELRARRADQSAIGALIAAKRSGGIAIASKNRREAEAEISEMKAAFLSANKRFRTPLLPDFGNADINLRVGCRIIEKMLPFLEAGHIEEARKEAQDFVDELNRRHAETDRSERT